MHPEFARLAAARAIARPRTRWDSPAAERTDAERWIRRFGVGDGHAPDVTVTRADRRVILTPRARSADAGVVLYIHGGGMHFYSADLFSVPLSIIASVRGCAIEAFDYDKAPECDPASSIADLAQRVCARCETADGPLMLAGDSVGALLALYLAVRVLPRTFARLVMIYPVLDLRTERPSYAQFGNGYFLDADAMRRFRSILTPFFARHGFDPFALANQELDEARRCTLVTAGCDVLRDEATAWSAHLAAQGIRPSHRHYADLPHDFCLYAGKLVSARRAVEDIATTSFDPEDVRTCT